MITPETREALERLIAINFTNVPNPSAQSLAKARRVAHALGEAGMVVVPREQLEEIATRTSWIGVPINTEEASHLGQELQGVVFLAQTMLAAAEKGE